MKTHLKLCGLLLLFTCFAVTHAAVAERQIKKAKIDTSDTQSDQIDFTVAQVLYAIGLCAKPADIVYDYISDILYPSHEYDLSRGDLSWKWQDKKTSHLCFRPQGSSEALYITPPETLFSGDGEVSTALYKSRGPAVITGGITLNYYYPDPCSVIKSLCQRYCLKFEFQKVTVSILPFKLFSESAGWQRAITELKAKE